MSTKFNQLLRTGHNLVIEVGYFRGSEGEPYKQRKNLQIVEFVGFVRLLSPVVLGFQRRDRDSNPRTRSPRSTVFETAPIDHSGISPFYRSTKIATSER